MPAETNPMTASVRSIIFMGTGTSGSIPNIPCITSNNKDCKVCKLSMTPEGSKNRRRNTSLLVCVDHPDGRQRNILIDCGKTFFDSALDVFLKYDIKTIDAVLLTHGHADAILGLDDLRPWTSSQKASIPIYCDRSTLAVVAETFPYLTDTSKATGSGEVPRLDFRVIDEAFCAFECEGVAFQPLRVEHGKCGDGRPFYFTGYRFGDVSYISDCSKIPDETRPLIAGTKLLVLDALKWTPHSSHFSFDEALDEVRFFKPDHTFLTDFCHRMEHSVVEQHGKKIKAEEGLDVRPAYDGLKIDL